VPSPQYTVHNTQPMRYLRNICLWAGAVANQTALEGGSWGGGGWEVQGRFVVFLNDVNAIYRR